MIHRTKKGGFGDFLDRFIVLVEKNGCVCGGGGKEDFLDVIVELGRRDQNPAERKAAIEKALLSDPEIQSLQIGVEFDLWHSDYQDLASDPKAEPASGVNGYPRGLEDYEDLKDLREEKADAGGDLSVKLSDVRKELLTD